MTRAGRHGVRAAPAPDGAGRRASARRERRRRRRQLFGASLAVAVLATLAVTAYFVQRDVPSPGQAPVAAERGRTQATLLLQLRAGAGEAVGSLLLAHDPATGAGAGLLVEPQVLTAAPGSAPVPFATLLRTGTGAVSRMALGDLLGVTVDAGWVLDPTAAALLVDAVGGIAVEVDSAVSVPGGAALAPGRQTLTGPAALAFATARAPSEPEAARLARLQQLIEGVLARLPVGSGAVADVLGSLGTGSVIEGATLTGLSELLAGLAAAGATVQYEAVPVLPEPAGGARLDVAAAPAVVERLFAASTPSGGGQAPG